MVSKTTSSIFPCSPLPSGTLRTPGLSVPWCCLPTSSSVCLVCSPLSLCLARWFWPDPMNGRHVQATAVCVCLHTGAVDKSTWSQKFACKLAERGGNVSTMREDLVVVYHSTNTSKRQCFFGRTRQVNRPISIPTGVILDDSQACQKKEKKNLQKRQIVFSYSRKANADQPGTS